MSSTTTHCLLLGNDIESTRLQNTSSHARRQTRWHSRRQRMGLWTMTEGSMRIVKDGEAHLIDLIAIVICLQLSHDSHYIMHILKLRIIPYLLYEDQCEIDAN
ncbi:hypothetical protein P8452_70066 [Trifolium repens]|nr:hypothetical protein P8452_70066 [Trifolium repens]